MELWELTEGEGEMLQVASDSVVECDAVFETNSRHVMFFSQHDVNEGLWCSALCVEVSDAAVVCGREVRWCLMSATDY